MQKLTLTGFVCLLLLLFGVSANAQDTYTSPGDFATKFWKEKYLGGGDGKPGNVLMAVGEGFVFQNAVLESVEGPVTVTSPCGGDFPGYRTTYAGGRLTLNPSGPWAENITVRDIAATNLSGVNATGERFFTLSFSGESKDGNLVDVTVTWCEDEDNYKRQVTKKNNKPVYQQGTGFEAEITIAPPTP